MQHQLPLIDRLEVPRQALRDDRLGLGHVLHDFLHGVAVDEAEVLLELVVGRLEFKIGRNVTAQPSEVPHTKMNTGQWIESERSLTSSCSSGGSSQARLAVSSALVAASPCGPACR